MFAKRMLIAFTFAVLSAANASAVGVRYFMSATGLANPDDEQSPAIAPNSTATDPSLSCIGPGGSPNPTRLYLWADITPGTTSPPTDLIQIDLSIRVEGQLQILRSNIWQRTLSDGGTPNDPSDDTRRWASAPGIQTWNSPSADLSAAIAGVETGLSTRTSVTSLDNQDRPGGVWLFGWVEIGGFCGDVQIENQASRFLQGTPATNQVFLGNDDTTGGLAEIPGQPISYSNVSPEAVFLVPEPSTLALLTLAALAIRRR